MIVAFWMQKASPAIRFEVLTLPINLTERRPQRHGSHASGASLSAVRARFYLLQADAGRRSFRRGGTPRWEFQHAVSGCAEVKRQVERRLIKYPMG